MGPHGSEEIEPQRDVLATILFGLVRFWLSVWHANCTYPGFAAGGGRWPFLTLRITRGAHFLSFDGSKSHAEKLTA